MNPNFLVNIFLGDYYDVKYMSSILLTENMSSLTYTETEETMA